MVSRACAVLVGREGLRLVAHAGTANYNVCWVSTNLGVGNSLVGVSHQAQNMTPAISSARLSWMNR